jgi:hypothetical protein
MRYEKARRSSPSQKNSAKSGVNMGLEANGADLWSAGTCHRFGLRRLDAGA